MTQPITQQYLQSLFDYKDGELFWKLSKAKHIHVGDKAGILHKNGYFRTGINSKLYSNHRLVYLYHKGSIPKYVDHIDGNKLNNKIENLREANKYQNQQNSKLSIKSTSGIKNVVLCPQTKKWAVKISINGFKKTIGRYNNIELAELVAIEARDKFHGNYARHI
jgi:hypothetical protein